MIATPGYARLRCRLAVRAVASRTNGRVDSDRGAVRVAERISMRQRSMPARPSAHSGRGRTIGASGSPWLPLPSLLSPRCCDQEKCLKWLRRRVANRDHRATDGTGGMRNIADRYRDRRTRADQSCPPRGRDRPREGRGARRAWPLRLMRPWPSSTALVALQTEPYVL